jgi:hypothetical protein
MPAKPSAFDVWLLAVDTVYKGVPFSVALGWAEQGRLTGTDKLRPAGQEAAPWVLAANHPQIAPYLFAPRPQPIRAGTPVPPLEPLERDDFARTPPDDDDDVDMIPLIDISLVLLIFFMMTTAVSSMSPVSVPELRNTGKLSGSKEVWVIQAEPTPNGDIVYGMSGGPSNDRELGIRTLPDLMTRFNAKLDANKPAEVRVAFHKQLVRRDRKELIRELEKLRTAGLVATYAAEVGEEK